MGRYVRGHRDIQESISQVQDRMDALKGIQIMIGASGNYDRFACTGVVILVTVDFYLDKTRLSSVSRS